MAYKIPFNRPTRTDQDLPYVQQALASGHLSGDGPFTKRCDHLFEQILGVPYATLDTQYAAYMRGLPQRVDTDRSSCRSATEIPPARH